MSEIRARHSLRKKQPNPNQFVHYGEASTDESITDEELYENEQDKSTENDVGKGTSFTTKSPREKAGDFSDYSDLNSNKYTESSLRKNHSLQAQKCTKIQEEFSCLQKFIIGMIFVAAISFSVFVSSGKTDDEKKLSNIEHQNDIIKKKLCSYQELKEKYPQENAIIWHSLQVGIEWILNAYDRKSGVYLFIHYENSNVDDIIEDIVKHASKCYNEKMKPIYMNISDFNSPKAMEEFGLIIEDFKNHIRESKVIVVVNVNEIPPETARALHTLCDTESPIDKEVVVFLTLQIPQVPIHNGTVLESNVEKILNDLWSSGMKSNELDALITRVTNNLVFLKGNTKIKPF